MARSSLAKLKNCPVDLIASSYNLDDQLFVRMIDGYFDNICYQYETVFVQISHHGSGLQDLNCNPLLFDEVRYEKNIRALIGFLQQYCKKIVLLSVMDFYRVRNDYPARICPGNLFHVLNKIAKKRNQILKHIATQNDLIFIDMGYELLNYKSYIVTDSIHPEDNMKPYMAKVLSKYI